MQRRERVRDVKKLGSKDWEVKQKARINRENHRNYDLCPLREHAPTFAYLYLYIS